MQRILIVEDSKLLGKVLLKKLESETLQKIDLVSSYQEALAFLDKHASETEVALLDLNLPDAPNGEIVDAVVSCKVPAIIFTGSFSEEAQDLAWSKGVVDYIIKEGGGAVDKVVEVVKRLEKNKATKILLVDDSNVSRRLIAQMLSVHRYQILEAKDGHDALNVLKKHPDVKLVITDFNMPNMDGFELTRQIRRSYDKRKLAVIGISAEGNNKLSAKFIKHGANDFLNKPFSTDEFYCRVVQNIELIEYVHEIQNAALHDFLTGLGNRRYFFNEVGRVHQTAHAEGKPYAVAMIDIDHFKKYNDTLGHDAGDELLRHVARILSMKVKAPNIIARFGGEEFCIFMCPADKENAAALCEDLRNTLANTPATINGQQHTLTVSIGVSTCGHPDIETCVNNADKHLYEAKKSGRNRVVTV